MVLGKTEEFYLKCAVAFFDSFVETDSNLIGENTLKSQVDEIEQNDYFCETCSAYYKLKFTKQLFLATNNTIRTLLHNLLLFSGPNYATFHATHFR